MRPFVVFSLAATAAAAAATAAACGDPFGLPLPVFANEVDTASLYALTGTPPATPSGFRLDFAQVVRLDQSTLLDFAFDIDTAGRAVLLPTGALHLGRNSGVQTTGTPFDSVTFATDRNYNLDSAVVVQVGTVVLVQSRLASCSWGGSAYYYAKLLVLAVDSATRKLDFQILIDKNCGYRGLAPGLPPR